MVFVLKVKLWIVSYLIHGLGPRYVSVKIQNNIAWLEEDKLKLPEPIPPNFTACLEPSLLPI